MTKAIPKVLLPIVEKPDEHDAYSNLASIRQYNLMSDPFYTLRGLSAGSQGKIQLADWINVHGQQGSVETVGLNGRRFYSGSEENQICAIQHEFKERVLLLHV